MHERATRGTGRQCIYACIRKGCTSSDHECDVPAPSQILDGTREPRKVARCRSVPNHLPGVVRGAVALPDELADEVPILLWGDGRKVAAIAGRADGLLPRGASDATTLSLVDEAIRYWSRTLRGAAIDAAGAGCWVAVQVRARGQLTRCGRDPLCHRHARFMLFADRHPLNPRAAARARRRLRCARKARSARRHR